MEFLVLGLFVMLLAASSLLPTYFIIKRKPKMLIRFIPTLGLLLLSLVLGLFSGMDFDPGSWSDLVFILYSLIAFYASIVSFAGVLALNWYFKDK